MAICGTAVIITVWIAFPVLARIAAGFPSACLAAARLLAAVFFMLMIAFPFISSARIRIPVALVIPWLCPAMLCAHGLAGPAGDERIGIVAPFRILSFLSFFLLIAIYDPLTPSWLVSARLVWSLCAACVSVPLCAASAVPSDLLFRFVLLCRRNDRAGDMMGFIGMASAFAMMLSVLLYALGFMDCFEDSAWLYPGISIAFLLIAVSFAFWESYLSPDRN